MRYPVGKILASLIFRRKASKAISTWKFEGVSEEDANAIRADLLAFLNKHLNRNDGIDAPAHKRR